MFHSNPLHFLQCLKVHPNRLPLHFHLKRSVRPRVRKRVRMNVRKFAPVAVLATPTLKIDALYMRHELPTRHLRPLRLTLGFYRLIWKRLGFFCNHFFFNCFTLFFFHIN